MLSLIHAVAGRPWAIRAEIALHVRGLLAREGISGLRHLAALKEEVHAFDPEGAARAKQNTLRTAESSNMFVVPVIGTLTQRGEMVGSAHTRSTADIAAEVRAAVMQPNVDAVLLEIDSPGGEVFGVPEAWTSIRESGRMKPVVAHANSVAASAALYLGSAANEFWVTPSGTVGSVGVYALHVDVSKALEQMGEAWDFIVAEKSPYKIEGNPAGPLTDEARGHMQREVNRYMDMFVRDLAKGRGVSEKAVLSDFGGGRMLSPTEAVRAKMADQVGTMDQAIRRAAQLGQQRRAGGVRAERMSTTLEMLEAPLPKADPEELRARAAMAGVHGFEEEE
jgi:signal peptide peptidase SppA